MGDAQSGSSTTTSDATADPSATSTGNSAATEPGDGLQALFQQMTKAIAAYATAGPAGIAASVLTSSSKA